MAANETCGSACRFQFMSAVPAYYVGRDLVGTCRQQAEAGSSVRAMRSPPYKVSESSNIRSLRDRTKPVVFSL